MKIKKNKKVKKNFYDPINIIFGNLYSKHKTQISNYNTAQINSILFNYSVPNSTQIIQAYYKEMVILCDSNEYMKLYYPYSETSQKLKVFGYIYINNFKPPPNYIVLDRFNRNIMLKLLIYKQELIDRYNYYMYQKKNNLNGDEDGDKEYDINLKNLYDSSDYMKTNKDNLISKKSSSRNKPILSGKNLKGKPKKNVHFSKDHFNLKSYISAIDDESKFESKGVSRYMDPIEIKENEDNNENSIDSIMKLMDKFINNKKIENNNIYRKKTKKISNLFDLKSNRDIRKKFSERQNKRGLTDKLLLSQNKIINLLKNYRKNFGKINKYYLSLDKFKEKLQENNKKKELIEKYWKINKNFVTNLIENKNIKIKNNNYRNYFISNTNFSPRFNFTSEESSSKNIINNNNNYNYNILSLSPTSKVSSLSSNTKITFSPLSYTSNAMFKKYKINFNKNKFSNSLENKKIKIKNSLIMKIQNNSDFMKNKKFYCVFSKLENNKTNNINKVNKNNKMKFIPFNSIGKNTFFNSHIFTRNNSFNFSKGFNIFRGCSPLNDNRFIKSLESYI